MNISKDRPGLIVIVDKAGEERDLVQNALIKKGYTTAVFDNGESALENMVELHPELIVSSVDLAGINGYGLCKKVRGIPRFENIPFVFISTEDKHGQDTIKGLRAGADDFINRPVIPEEIVLRIDIILKRLKILRRLTITDELTGLFNRRYFDQRLDEEIERLKRYNRPLGVWIVDIDNFKEINDSMGHEVGDIVLEKIGKTILDIVRGSDVLARYGGDEFGIIMPEHSPESMLNTGERIRKIVSEKTIDVDAHGSFEATVSIGGKWVSDSNESSSGEIIRIADQMMYKAKKDGRNKVKVEF